MSALEALFLGVLQGFTEFLPVSSSGHLVLAETYLGLSVPHADLLGFDVLLHAATALALYVCYHKQWNAIIAAPFKGDTEKYRFVLLIIIASIPAGLAGVLLQDMIVEQFRSESAVAIALMITGVILILGAKLAQQNHKSPRMTHAVWMGIAQAFAIVPGLSRSGLTISMGQVMGLKREQALDFSFQMAMPVIAGAMLLTTIDVVAGTVNLPGFAVSFTGFVASFLSSFVAIFCLRAFVARHNLSWFSLYLLPIGLTIFLVA